MHKSKSTFNLVYNYIMIMMSSIAIKMREPPSPDWVNPYHARRGILSITGSIQLLGIKQI